MRISEQVFHSLKGTWRLSRIIYDHQNTTEMVKVEGKAEFKEITSNYLEYREDVKMVGKTIESYREYIYKFEFGRVKIFFCEDNKPTYIYNSLKFEDRGHLMAHDEHLCKRDKYRSIYHFYDRNRFYTNCKVIGPLKNYEISTLYTKELAH